MGFRGSRVQIPPSRLVTQPGCCLGCRFHLSALHSFSNLALFVHHGEERLVIWLLVGGKERLRIPPASGCSDILEREIFALGRPFAAIRMPQPSLQLGQFSLLLRKIVMHKTVIFLVGPTDLRERCLEPCECRFKSLGGDRPRFCAGDKRSYGIDVDSKRLSPHQDRLYKETAASTKRI